MAKLKWRDSEEVYQPTNLPLSQFLKELITSRSIGNSRIQELLEKHHAQKMSVFVADNAVEQLRKHLSKDPYNETGGVLVGKAYFCPETKTPIGVNRRFVS